MKNPVPQFVAFFSAMILALFSLLILLTVHLKITRISIIIWLVLPFTLFLFAYLVFLFFIKRYIHRKIKLIYKYILNTKSGFGSGIKKHSFPDLSIVEKDVEQWAHHQKDQMKSLEQTAKYRREFVGNVSHELRTPIFNMQGYLETLLDHGVRDEKVTLDYLKKALENLERMNRIVNNLEVISRLEEGGVELNLNRININALAKEVMGLLAVPAKEEQVVLSIKAGCDKSFWVLADEDLIRQVLINLVFNAIKYSKPNQEGIVKIGFYDMVDHILTEVSDQGIGIAAKHLPHIYERFYRIDKGRSRKTGGSGLGLSIVKHIIDAHGQTVNVRSRYGFGSTFGFTLKKA